MVYIPRRTQNFQGKAVVLRQLDQRIHVRLGKHAAHAGTRLQAARRDLFIQPKCQRKVYRIRSNPLFRALRVDKLTYAALEATLMAYLRADYAAIPALRFMTVPAHELRGRAEAVAAKLRTEAPHLEFEIVETQSILGGGAAPTATLSSLALAVTRSGSNPDQLASALRKSKPPIIARIVDDRVLLDFRTVLPEQDADIARSLVALNG